MSNLSNQLQRRLSADQQGLLRKVSHATTELGAALYLVGGTVRDLLNGGGPVDLDLVVEGGGADFASALAASVGGEVLMSSQFGTFKLGVDGVVIDLVAARKETYERPGALPSVGQGTVLDDLARRDFSINAMCVSLETGRWGDLLDPHQGRRDLGQRLVRVLHSDSFVDDATRILRAVRYVCRLGLALEDGTRALVARDLAQLDTISGDRLRHEIERLLREPLAPTMLQEAEELGVLRAVHPALHLPPDLLDKLREMGGVNRVEDEAVLLGLLVFSAPPPQVLGLVSRLNLAGRSSRVVRDVASLRRSLDMLGRPDVRPSAVAEVLRGLDEAAIKACAIAVHGSAAKERLEGYLDRLRYVETELNGDDLLRLGVPQGPEVGRILDLIIKARLDGLLSTREDEETLVRRSLEQGF